MIADYAKDSKLFERCINLINAVFPGCKEFATNALKYGASWSEISIPFIIEDKGEIVAHAGVWPITLILNGKEHHTASIHGVCVKPEHRGKGYFKELMQEAMQYVEERFDSSILFTEKPYLYKSYPYKEMLPAYDFFINEQIKFKQKDADLRVLTLDNPNDLKIMNNLLSSRVPLSDHISITGKNGGMLFIFNTQHKKIHYSEKLNAAIIFEIKKDTLYIEEIISSKQYKISEILELIPESFDKVVLQFCPDRFLPEKDYTAKLTGIESCVMVSDKFAFNGKYFRYPDLYCC